MEATRQYPQAFLLLTLTFVLSAIMVQSCEKQRPDPQFWRNCGVEGDRFVKDTEDGPCRCNTEAGYISLYGGQVCTTTEELDLRYWKEVRFLDAVPNLPFKTLLFGSPLKGREPFDSMNTTTAPVPFGGEQSVFWVGLPNEKVNRTSPMDPYYCQGNPNHNVWLTRYFSGSASNLRMNPYRPRMQDVPWFTFNVNFFDLDADCRAEPGTATGFVRNDTMYGTMITRDWETDPISEQWVTDTFRFIGVPWGPPYQHHE